MTAFTSFKIPLSTALNPEWWSITLKSEEEPEESPEGILNRVEDLLARIAAGGDSPDTERMPSNGFGEEMRERFEWQYDAVAEDGMPRFPWPHYD